MSSRPAVGLKMPGKPLFVGSYVKIPVVIDPGLTIDDLDFVVPDGLKAGFVSLSRDKTFNRKEPDIMLCVGYEPGTYLLQVFEKASGTQVAEEKYEVTSLWQQDKVGPPLWFTGQMQGYSAGSAWGGGPAGAQNVSVIPASGTRRIAILLVDTSSQRYTTDNTVLQGHRDRWLNEVINGVVGADGTTRSTRLFYREASYNGFDLSAQVFGPVQLSGTWDDYFNSDGSPKGSYYQACFTAGDSLINYNNFDSLLCASQSVPAAGMTPAKSAWPYASIGLWGPYTTAEGNKNYGVISMPNEWGTTSDREIFETFSHELGHNLGMGDMYNPTVAGRNPGGWEMMHADDPLPHFSAAHRMMLGWVPAARVRAFNFSSMAVPVDQTVTLHPIELGAPPAGRFSAIEIRLADGWNYYFEYRNGQVAQIGDRNLPTNNRVLGTDVVSPPWIPPISRPGILLLLNDADGDGPVLDNGQDYEETDNTTAGFPAELKVDVSGVDGSKADVRIRYGIIGKPDPSIRPWPASPDRQWQSPDIEVRNARNMADPAWFNVPWVGNTNTVIARIRNAGTLNADGVRANFFVKNYNIGGAPETPLGSDVKNIGPGATVDFSTTWTPPSEGHYCIIVRIPLYQTPTAPSVVEMTEFNNIAQSNYDRFISATTVGKREITSVEVGNPYADATRVFVTASQNNPIYRTFLEHTWLWLEPGETRQVQVMFEYAAASIRKGKLDDSLDNPDVKEFYRIPNNVGLTGFIEDPRDNPRHAILVHGGGQVQVVTGRSTEFEQFDVDKEGARGRIVTVEDRKAVPGGKVILILTTGKGDQQKKDYIETDVKDGEFFSPVRPGWTTAQAYYVPAPTYADCTSDEKQLPKDEPPPVQPKSFIEMLIEWLRKILDWLTKLFSRK